MPKRVVAKPKPLTDLERQVAMHWSTLVRGTRGTRLGAIRTQFVGRCDMDELEGVLNLTLMEIAPYVAALPDPFGEQDNRARNYCFQCLMRAAREHANAGRKIIKPSRKIARLAAAVESKRVELTEELERDATAAEIAAALGQPEQLVADTLSHESLALPIVDALDAPTPDSADAVLVEHHIRSALSGHNEVVVESIVSAILKRTWERADLWSGAVSDHAKSICIDSGMNRTAARNSVDSALGTLRALHTGSTCHDDMNIPNRHRNFRRLSIRDRAEIACHIRAGRKSEAVARQYGIGRGWASEIARTHGRQRPELDRPVVHLVREVLSKRPGLGHVLVHRELLRQLGDAAPCERTVYRAMRQS